MAVIVFMGTNSGAHLNPVVTIAFALRRDFPWRRALGYILAQLLGASAAAYLLRGPGAGRTAAEAAEGKS